MEIGYVSGGTIDEKFGITIHFKNENLLSIGSVVYLTLDSVKHYFKVNYISFGTDKEYTKAVNYGYRRDFLAKDEHNGNRLISAKLFLVTDQMTLDKLHEHSTYC